MIALLLDIQPGDEIIMPSFTFVSTANAFASRGARIVFIDISEDTLNLDVSKIESAISPKTRAIVAVHYAGIAADLKRLQIICKNNNLVLIEDAACALGARLENRPLGAWGDLSALSFHETKNVHCGVGGALIINNPQYQERSSKIWLKGTNRIEYMAGAVDKYTWVDLGGAFAPSELQAALLWGQLEMLMKYKGKESKYGILIRKASPLVKMQVCVEGRLYREKAFIMVTSTISFFRAKNYEII